MMTSSLLYLFLLLAVGGTTRAQTPSPAERLPNIGYIGYGYNVFYGNPQDSSEFDPGFGEGIFLFIQFLL